MPGGQIRSGIFNRRAASAISGVESSAKARNSESVFTLRRCSYSASFAKGVRLKDEGRKRALRMRPEERSRLDALDAALRSEDVHAQIRPDVWHRPVVGRDADWAVVSFHTVEAHELIEEKPDTSSKSGTKQMKYLATKVGSKS